MLIKSPQFDTKISVLEFNGDFGSDLISWKLTGFMRFKINTFKINFNGTFYGFRNSFFAGLANLPNLQVLEPL